MSLQFLDSIFPFFVFFYGILLIFVLENSSLDRLGKAQFPEVFAVMQSHRKLAWICFFVGGFWSLQNILFA